ncbi:hypothetical protein GCM10023152_34470 [Agromyces bauzanensis]|uniref:Transposase n=1 Tax=Agromyces bauzanensis TaxID=1308924 RepID=A0A917PUN2_9MICO|nr:hypothetical protein GCM10011372_33690 [Agromyces bauzanensis]
MIHVGVTKFGNIPDGSGHRFVGRQQGAKNKLSTPGLPRGKDHKPRTGTAFGRTVIDDYSRVSYVEICNDERADTAIGCCVAPRPAQRPRPVHRAGGAARRPPRVQHPSGALAPRARAGSPAIRQRHSFVTAANHASR